MEKTQSSFLTLLENIVLSLKKLLKLGFRYAFGQHSGVIDETKDLLELPRFPINEKYGEIDRFQTLMKTLPLKFKNIT